MDHVVQIAPYFFIGRILVKRRELLEPFTTWLQNHPSVRLCCFLANVALYVDVIGPRAFYQFWIKLLPYTFSWQQRASGMQATSVSAVFLMNAEIPVILFAIAFAIAWVPT